MKEVFISDRTIGCSGTENVSLTFREKIECARLLDRLGVSGIELGTLTGSVADNLLIKSLASVVPNASVAVCAGLDENAVACTWEALKTAAHPRLQVRAAVSTSRMEYVYHKKAKDMLAAAENAVRTCKKLTQDVEFIAEDATRADEAFLCDMLRAVIKAGANRVTVSDTAGAFLPEEFGAFLLRLKELVPELSGVVLGAECSDALGLALASALCALRAGVTELKVSVPKTGLPESGALVTLLSAKGEALDARCGVSTTEIKRVLLEILKMCEKDDAGASPFEDGVRSLGDDRTYTAASTEEEIRKGIAFLGYELDENDQAKVFAAFRKIAGRKENVTLGELDAIIASEAMQVPATFTLENYLVTTGNATDILAHVKLRRGNELLDGVSLGDGPIDAAFLAIEKITGHHYELDDFQIQAVSEGREAMGQTVVKLRWGGKLYSGRGLSTDIIGSGVAAYVSALNKIMYEEEHA